MAMLLLLEKKIADVALRSPYRSVTIATTLSTVSLAVAFMFYLELGQVPPDVDRMRHYKMAENATPFAPHYDPNSYSNPHECKVVNLHLNLDVNFTKKILDGYVDLTVERKEVNISHLHLDTRGLSIKGITDLDTRHTLPFVLHVPHKAFGARLVVELPKTKKIKFVFRIVYETSPSSTALQWLTPAQTAGRLHPYLFSQNQAIHARSMLPCQDSPNVKAPFTAAISAPAELMVLMGALRNGSDVHPGDWRKKIHRFIQPINIPSYLIAVVVGALESRSIGPRSLVWSEAEIIDIAAFEFSETEKMLKAAEEIMGPYVWKEYNILVMPPSFPFGGMENPCLTFVTPTLLAGDKSLASVIAHEISHSWTGNLVTNKNFEHFWLNEGFTMFAERKIISKLYGEIHRDFHAVIGWKDLEESIKTQGENNPMTKLVVNLTETDPDDAFSVVPYEKGHSLLYYLESKVGGKVAFEPFFRQYIDTFKYQSIDTEQWKKFFLFYFNDKVTPEALNTIDWDSWLFDPGMPPVELQFNIILAESSRSLAQQWINTSVKELQSFSKKDIAEMSAWQICEFLSVLLKEENFSVEKLKAMQSAYDFNGVKNSEIRFRWIRLGIKSQWPDILPLALKFINEQGRMKFVRPIYRDLYNWKEMRAKAIDNYKSTKHQMMFVTSSMVAKDLHLNA